MMSPFTLFFNRSDIVELTKHNDRHYVHSPDKLLFKVYSKIEANLERTLLKVSFNDVKILKGLIDHLSVMLNKEYLRLAEETREINDKSNMKQLNDEALYLNKYCENSGIHENLRKKIELSPVVEQTENS